jgi:hypothetical protein
MLATPVSVINSDRITLTMVCMERGFQDLPVGNFKFPLGFGNVATGAMRLAFLALKRLLYMHPYST